MAGANPAADAVMLLGRAEKLEETLATTRRTLAEHVDENLALHARVAELEKALNDLVTSSTKLVVELEADVARLTERAALAEGRYQGAAEMAERAQAKVAELERQLLLAKPLRLRWDREEAVLKALAACETNGDVVSVVRAEVERRALARREGPG